MKFVLYRSNVSLTSGAGQLMRIQAEALRTAGKEVCIACRTGWLKLKLRTGLRVRRASPERLTRRAGSDGECVVDHGLEISNAHLVFVHNVMAEGVRHLPREDWRSQAERERAFFAALNPAARIVANSRLVKHALAAHFEIPSDRLRILYPGIDVERFRVPDRAVVAAAARRAVGIAPSTPLVGFITSGDLEKRGLDMFLDAAERIVSVRPDARFLVVGSRRLPEWAGRRALVRRRHLIYRPKTAAPEKWLPALDVFLYPARFEEFGMVVGEALAARLPVVTSRHVGAAECLPAEYAPWLLDTPDAEAFAASTVALLDDADARARLGAAGAAAIAAYDRAAYARASVELICAAARTG